MSQEDGETESLEDTGPDKLPSTAQTLAGTVLDTDVAHGEEGVQVNESHGSSRAENDRTGSRRVSTTTENVEQELDGISEVDFAIQDPGLTVEPQQNVPEHISADGDRRQPVDEEPECESGDVHEASDYDPSGSDSVLSLAHGAHQQSGQQQSPVLKQSQVLNNVELEGFSPVASRSTSFTRPRVPATHSFDFSDHSFSDHDLEQLESASIEIPDGSIQLRSDPCDAWNNVEQTMSRQHSDHSPTDLRPQPSDSQDLAETSGEGHDHRNLNSVSASDKDTTEYVHGTASEHASLIIHGTDDPREHLATSGAQNRSGRGPILGVQSFDREDSQASPLNSVQTRPNSRPNEIRNLSTHEQEQFPDISYEQSFLPPSRSAYSTAGHLDHTDLVQARGAPSVSRHNSGLDSIEVNRLIDDVKSNMLLQDADPDAVLHQNTSHLWDDHTDSPAVRRLLADRTKSFDRFLSPKPSTFKVWETPAATKEYMNEVPTRTAIVRRVESFQIPAERLAALQPDIAAMQKQNRKPSDKQSLKESTAQIDSLLNENWGLKMKIMFMDQHFEQDKEKADLIAENVRLQTNGFNFVQQVKARDRTIRALERTVQETELRNAKLEADANVGTGSEDLDQKFQEMEHYIGVLEKEHDNEIQRLENALDELKAQQLVAHRSQSSEESAHDTELLEEMKRSLAEAEQEIQELETEFEFRLQEADEALTSRTHELLEHREKLAEISETLRAYEHDLLRADELRQRSTEELRATYDAERIEYEMYIEDRHEEIDNLKQAVSSYNQDSFEARLEEAIKPYREAWRDMNRQCMQLKEEVDQRESAFSEELRTIQEQLEDSVNREAGLSGDITELRDLVHKRTCILQQLEANLDRVTSELSDTKARHKVNNLRNSADHTVINSDALNQAKDLLVAELESRVKKFESGNECLTINLDDSEQKLQLAREELSDALAKAAQSAEESQAKDEQISRLDALCHRYEDELSELHEELDETNHALAMLRKKHEERDRQSRDLQAELDMGRSQKENALRSLEAMAADLHGTQAQLEALRACVGQFVDCKDVSHDEIMKLIDEHLRTSELDRSSLRKNNQELSSAHEKSVFEVAKHEKLAVQSVSVTSSLQKKIKVLEHDRDRLSTQVHELHNSIRDNRETQHDARRDLQRASAQAVQFETETLQFLLSMLSRLRALFDHPVVRSGEQADQDIGSIKTDLLALFDDINRKKQTQTADTSALEASLRKQVMQLESQLTTKNRLEKNLQARLERLKRENATPPGREREPSVQNYNDVDGLQTNSKTKAPSSLARPLTSVEPNGRASGDEYWTLHERIKVLTRDLKYQKELREQDDKAAKIRLAESKRERQELQEKMRRLLGSGVQARDEVLTIEGSQSGDESIAANGSNRGGS